MAVIFLSPCCAVTVAPGSGSPPNFTWPWRSAAGSRETIAPRPTKITERSQKLEERTQFCPLVRRLACNELLTRLRNLNATPASAVGDRAQDRHPAPHWLDLPTLRSFGMRS